MQVNKQTVKKLYDAFNMGDMDGYAKLFSPDAKNHGIPVGREGIVLVVTDIRYTFPDITLTPIEIFAEGDWVISRDIFSGTFKNKAGFPHHGGLLMTNDPTYKSFSVQHIHMYKLQDNLITEHYANRDDVDMYQQLGLLPAPPAIIPPSMHPDKSNANAQ